MAQDKFKKGQWIKTTKDFMGVPAGTKGTVHSIGFCLVWMLLKDGSFLYENKRHFVHCNLIEILLGA